MLMLCMAECSDKKNKEGIKRLDSVVNKSICTEKESCKVQCFADATDRATECYTFLPHFCYNIMNPAVKRGYLTLVVLILFPA